MKSLRIDKGLINSSVIRGWCEFLSVTNIVVANKHLVKDEILSMVQKMAVPKGIKIAIKDLPGTVELLHDSLYADLNILIIVNTPKDALILLQEFPDISNVYVGHYDQSSEADKTNLPLSPTFIANTIDIECFRSIVAIQPYSVYQVTATQVPIPLKDLIV